MPPVEQRSTKRHIVRNPDNGGHLLTAESVETVIVDPTTGGRRFESTKITLRTKDCRLITNPDESVYACAACNQEPFAGPAVTHCSKCQHIICRTCVVTINDVEFCPRCARKRAWQQFWSRLWSI